MHAALSVGVQRMVCSDLASVGVIFTIEPETGFENMIYLTGSWVLGENGLEIYVMIEIPSNIILTEKFAKVFHGFSIGSNDLPQLTLGIDRDSAIISNLFGENSEAVK